MSSTNLLESKMRELGRQTIRAGDSTFVPNLLEWMGRAFGDAVERANHKGARPGVTQLESLIQALPAAIYAPEAAGSIRF